MHIQLITSTSTSLRAHNDVSSSVNKGTQKLSIKEASLFTSSKQANGYMHILQKKKGCGTLSMGIVPISI